MNIRLPLLVALLLGASSLRSEEPVSSPVRIKPKAFSTSPARSARDGGVQPDTDVIDAPTTAALDNYGYSSRSRFYSRGGILQYLSDDRGIIRPQQP